MPVLPEDDEVVVSAGEPVPAVPVGVITVPAGGTMTVPEPPVDAGRFVSVEEGMFVKTPEEPVAVPEPSAPAAENAKANRSSTTAAAYIRRMRISCIY